LALDHILPEGLAQCLRSPAVPARGCAFDYFVPCIQTIANQFGLAHLHSSLRFIGLAVPAVKAVKTYLSFLAHAPARVLPFLKEFLSTCLRMISTFSLPSLSPLLLSPWC